MSYNTYMYTYLHTHTHTRAHVRLLHTVNNLKPALANVIYSHTHTHTHTHTHIHIHLLHTLRRSETSNRKSHDIDRGWL